MPRESTSADEGAPEREGDDETAQVLEFPVDPGAKADESHTQSKSSVPVPAGTWASDESTEGAAELVRPSTTGRVPRPTPPDGEVVPLTAAEPSYPKPKYLASELLRFDWYPVQPLRRTGRLASVFLGTVGAIVIFAVAGTSLAGGIFAVLLAASAGAGAVPWSPRARSIALASLCALGMGSAVWFRGPGDAEGLLWVATTLASSVLFYRAAHRRSRVARGLVTLGLVALAGWIVSSGGLAEAVVQDWDWSHWVQPISRLGLGLTLLGCALTFLDPTGEGGAYVGGGILIGWTAARGAALGIVDVSSGTFSDATLSLLIAPVFVALGAITFAQLMARAGAWRRKRAQPAALRTSPKT